MNLSENKPENKRITKAADCPNLLEWTGWMSSFCTLRYKSPDFLTNNEIEEYCKNKNYCNCVFYIKQLEMISKTHMVQGD
jgi:hypothetical protein